MSSAFVTVFYEFKLVFQHRSLDSQNYSFFTMNVLCNGRSEKQISLTELIEIL